MGSGAPSPSHHPGSHDLEFREAPFAYLDSYFGGSDFIGEEVVYYHDQPVWAENGSCAMAAWCMSSITTAG
jgi:hypothetical protein